MTSSASPLIDTNHKESAPFLLPNTRRKAEQLFDLFSRSEDGQRALQNEVLNSSPMLGDDIADALLFLTKVTLGSCHASSPDSLFVELSASQQVPPKSPNQRRRRHSSGTGKKR